MQITGISFTGDLSVARLTSEGELKLYLPCEVEYFKR